MIFSINKMVMTVALATSVAATPLGAQDLARISTHSHQEVHYESRDQGHDEAPLFAVFGVIESVSLSRQTVTISSTEYRWDSSSLNDSRHTRHLGLERLLGPADFSQGLEVLFAVDPSPASDGIPRLLVVGQ